jgi:hypothetical protein
MATALFAKDLSLRLDGTRVEKRVPTEVSRTCSENPGGIALSAEERLVLSIATILTRIIA